MPPAMRASPFSTPPHRTRFRQMNPQPGLRRDRRRSRSRWKKSSGSAVRHRARNRYAQSASMGCGSDRQCEQHGHWRLDAVSVGSNPVAVVSATTVLSMVPTPLISTVTWSPAVRNRFGTSLLSVPPGVPVRMTSPGCSVVKAEINATRVGTVRISCEGSDS